MSELDDPIGTAFAAAHPRAIDFPKLDYERRPELFDQSAAQHGYRLAGFRLERAVFTTKPAPKEAEAETID